MQPLRDEFLAVPLRQRYSSRQRTFDVGMALHVAAVAAGVPVYRDPATGNSVFTAAFLADRGYCCESGCRHCPFAADGVDNS